MRLGQKIKNVGLKMQFIRYLAKRVIKNTLEVQKNLGQSLRITVVPIVTIVKT